MTVASPAAADVHALWFGDLDASPAVPPEVMKRWFTRDEAFDRRIAAELGETLERAARGELAAWDAAPRGWLAHVIVLDQFPRNAFRGTARAFAYDAEARRVAEAGLARGDDQALLPVERPFVYLPFEHAESLEDQRRAVALFRRLLEENPSDPNVLFLKAGDEFAGRHLDVIARFGRFPHRNAVLGRESTAEEIEFLKQPGSSF